MGHRRCTTGARSSAVLVAIAVLAGCGSTAAPRAPETALGDDAITIASFDFPESELLAELYGQSLEAAGYRVEQVRRAGPRELVDPALARGVVEIVPEYAGTAVEFLGLGSVEGSADVAENHAALERVLGRRDVTALDPAPAEDRNTLVVTEETAARLELDEVSDLRRRARHLSFGGPPECPARPLCLPGLETLYGLRFREFVPLDAGGPLTVESLEAGFVDVALLFTTNPALAHGLVALTDDRGLQPAENITPLVHDEVISRFGPDVAARLDRVSARLRTADLRRLNAEAASGDRPVEVARRWLVDQGLA